MKFVKVLSGMLSCLSLSMLSVQTEANNDKSKLDSVAFEKTFNVKLPQVKTPVFKKDTFDIVKFGAKPDGITLNTQSINSAIDACSKNGGGVVLVSGGVWLTGPIYLKSNVNLHLQRDAVILFTDDKSQYKLIEGNWEGKPAVANESPISGSNLENIAITGGGVIDGNGGVWRFVKRSKLTGSQWNNLIASGGVADKNNWYPSESYLKGQNDPNARTLAPGKTLADYEDKKDFYRPNLLFLNNCKSILLEDVTFQNSPAWCLHPLLCEDLTLRRVQVRNPWFAQNGDGLDVESCKNVLIEESTFDVGDDAICIKSGRDEAGRERGVPTEEVIIRNNIVFHGHGGFVVGSEMSGGARNIFVYNNSFLGTDIGIRFKTRRNRGGVVEKVYIANTYMKDIPEDAILFDMYYEAKIPTVSPGETRPAPAAPFQPVNEGTPQFKDIYIKNAVCIGAKKGLFVRGLPEMNIKNIYLEDIVLKADIGVEIIDATNINLKNVHLVASENNPLIVAENSKQITIDGLKSGNPVKVLMNLAGERTSNIILKNSDIKSTKENIQFNYGAKASALKTK